jgi:DNA mismatch repair protein MutS
LFAAPPEAPAPEQSALDKALQQIDPDALSPREALDALYQLKKIAGRE